MINQDFSEYPEHRIGFFKLLRAINLSCFPGMIQNHLVVLYPHARDFPLTSTVGHPTATIQVVHGQYYLGYQAYHAGYCRYWIEL